MPPVPTREDIDPSFLDLMTQLRQAVQDRPDDLRHLIRDAAKFDELVHPDPLLGELTDGEQRSVDRQRRHDRVDARPVGQAGVDKG